MAKTKTPPEDKTISLLEQLIEQAIRGNAGLIVISVATAEDIVKRLRGTNTG